MIHLLNISRQLQYTHCQMKIGISWRQQWGSQAGQHLHTLLVGYFYNTQIRHLDLTSLDRGTGDAEKDMTLKKKNNLSSAPGSCPKRLM